MATTPRGYPYPTNSDAPNAPAQFQALATAIDTDMTSRGVTVAFTPSWSNVTLGTSAVNEGYYTVIGDLVFWQFRTEFGTSPSFSTTIQLGLPVAGWTGGGLGLQGTIGTWTMRDSSSQEHYSGSIGMWQADGTLASFAGAWDSGASKPSARMGPAKPITVAVQDVLSGSGVYRKA